MDDDYSKTDVENPVTLLAHEVSSVSRLSPVRSTESNGACSRRVPDINRNPITGKDNENTCDIHPQLGGQIDLTSEAGSSENSQTPNHTTVSMQSDLERSHRLDLLWKVCQSASGPLLEQESSVSNCEIQDILVTPPDKPSISNPFGLVGKKFSNIPGANDHDKDLSDSLSDEEVEEKAIEAQRNSNEDDKPGSGNFGRQPSEQPPDLPMVARESFNWPWHRGNYRLTIRFEDPAFRSLFATKLLMLKLLQWVVVVAWTLGMRNITYITKHTDELMWTLYLATFVYVSTYLSVRSTRIMESNTLSILALVIFASSLSHIFAMIYAHFDVALVPAFALCVVFTYFAIYFTSLFFPSLLDPKTADVGIPLTISLFTFSIGSYFLVMYVRDQFNSKQVTHHIGDVWFTSFALALIVTTVEIMEMQSVVTGRRVPLDESNWILAATFVF